MFTRSFASFATAVALFVPSTAVAQTTVTADDVVRAALSRPELAALVEAQVATVQAEVAVQTLIPTPTLALSNEHVFGDENVGYTELSVMAEQQVDLTGWRDALRATVPHREQAERATMQVRRLDAATVVREAFYRARYHQERIAAVDGWIAHLRRGLDGLRAREDQGDAATYEVLRIERELEIARAVQARDVSALAEAWADLEAWTQWDARPDLSGALAPPAHDPPAELELPDIARLHHLELALDAERDAWGAPFWRGWTVGAGYRFATVGTSVGHGLLVNLAVPLPLWNNDAPQLERLDALQVETARERELLSSLAQREVDAALVRLEAALAALQALPSPEQDAELSRLAQLAFDAGESSLVELLDALRSETDLQLARLDLQWEARRAAITLDRRRGQGVPE